MIMGLPSGALRSVLGLWSHKVEIFSSFGGKRFYGPPPCLFEYQYEIFLGFMSFFSPMGSKSVLNLFQHLATVTRQIKSTLMAKLADPSSFDKFL